MPPSIPAPFGGGISTWARWRGKKRLSKELVSLLDDDPAHLTVDEWADRNRRLYDELARRRLIDPAVVPPVAHRFLTETLINSANPAATDPLNAGHVRAQNNNVLHYGLSLGVSPDCLSVALEAGFIHDLNKAVGEPLRSDRFAVRDSSGEVVERLQSVAQAVGLNHLGERTRRALEEATRLADEPLSPEVASAVDRCIIHHGLGSSHFIQALIDGANEWWGEEFVDPQTGVRKLNHPPQPPLSLESVIHDLADSTQQMQGGVAWLIKYPEGFWREANHSFWSMLSQDETPGGRDIAMSLKEQIAVESATCQGIVAEARAERHIDARQSERLMRAIEASIERSRAWIRDDEETLSKKRGDTIYHDIAKGSGMSTAEAVERLKNSRPGDDSELDNLIWQSAQALDTNRALDLADLIERSSKKKSQ